MWMPLDEKDALIGGEDCPSELLPDGRLKLTLFRRGYTINVLNLSDRLHALQELLSHRDINTTRICLRLPHDDVKRKVR